MSEIDRRTASLILVPTRRLARTQRRALADARSADGQTAWRAPEVLALPAWLGQLGRTALLHGLTDRVPITSGQARPLWQQVIDADVFVGEPRVHALCERAWRTLHEYGLPAPQQWPDVLLSEDSRRFREGVRRFEQRCQERGLIEEWALYRRLPGWIASGRLPLPSRIVLVGFDRPPVPIVAAVFDALESAGVVLEGRPVETLPELPEGLELLQFDEADDELLAAARWARERLEHDPDCSIAVVVPDLSGRRARVERAFRRVFDSPGFALEASGAAPWHVSLGPALADWSLVADALLLLRLDPAAMRQADAGRLLLSPYLGAAEVEADARARAQVRLLGYAPYEITIRELASACRVNAAAALSDRLDAWAAARRSATAPTSPSDWVARFQTELAALGFGRGRALDSVEWQVLARWHALLEEFAMLDVVLERPIARSEALPLLGERARGIAFRERNPGCPVEILGVEEALGSRFDAVWITTLDSAHWPGAPRRESLIPGPIQAGLPQATAEGRLDQARRDLAGLLQTGETVRLSFARGRDEAPLDPAPLLAHGSLTPVVAVSEPASSLLESVGDDATGPRHAEARAPGGVGLLQDQSACPFKAFARYRLGARPLRGPRPGLDSAQRGQLRHWALQAFWRELRGREALRALDDAQLQQRIGVAVDEALGRLVQDYRLALSPAARRLEQRSIERMLGRWLRLERERREDFRVVGRELKVELEFAGLRLRGQIDRIDETPVGRLLIDYKTGRVGRGNWKPDARIADPQLPAYALAEEPPPVGIAFALLRPDGLRFDGAAAEDPGVDGVLTVGPDRGQWKVASGWSELLAAWQENLDGLARAFVAGEAAVDPRKRQDCRYCGLQALCRIDERGPLVEDEEDQE